MRIKLFTPCLFVLATGCSTFRMVTTHDTENSKLPNIDNKITINIKYTDKNSIDSHLKNEVREANIYVANELGRKLKLIGVSGYCLIDKSDNCPNAPLLEIETYQPFPDRGPLQYFWLMATGISFGLIPYTEEGSIQIHGKYYAPSGKVFDSATSLEFRSWLSIFLIPFSPKNPANSEAIQFQYLNVILTDLHSKGAFL